MRNIGLVAVPVLSLAIGIGLGMLDRETQSLNHLFTAEAGNLMAIALSGSVFSCLGWLSVRYLSPSPAPAPVPVRVKRS
ncbi:MAG: hypothetical protein AAGF97_12600 [Planctomycetota bacterium]